MKRPVVIVALALLELTLLVGPSFAQNKATPATLSITVSAAHHQNARPVVPEPRKGHRKRPWTRYWIIRTIKETFVQKSRALCVGNHESRFQYGVVNSTGHAGIFQLARFWYNGVFHFNPLNPMLNIHYAHLIAKNYGWHNWHPDCGIP